MVLVLKKPKQALPLDDPDGRRYTAKEAAAILGMSVKTLMKHVKAGRIRFVDVSTTKTRCAYRFTQKALTVFTQNNKVRKTPPCPSTSPITATPIGTISNTKNSGFTSLVALQTAKKLKG